MDEGDCDNDYAYHFDCLKIWAGHILHLRE